MSCEDKIRWEIFRPLSSPLNSVVSFSAAPHQKGNVASRKNKNKTKAHKTRGKEGTSGGSLKKEWDSNVRHRQNVESEDSTRQNRRGARVQVSEDFASTT